MLIGWPLLICSEKDSQDASRASRNVAKSHIHVLHAVALRKFADEQFRQFFGKAHEASRVDGLVGGNVDERFHPGFHSRKKNISGPRTLLRIAWSG